ncbi:MAG: polysaccharide export protein [Oscillatoriophycideae cyanobacterium NC_groundwater_1537_Pr4_S-0.65um_50_18]|nr:polysaccharide export protein [Oscillatoriophycideae cyanobacterium NC_groundwater_1537_Pr4_S-0.65um_50_18]
MVSAPPLPKPPLASRFVPSILLFWLLQAGLLPLVALSQPLHNPANLPFPPSLPPTLSPTLPPSLPPSHSPSPTQQLLKDARQRLIDRGELTGSPDETGNAPHTEAAPLDPFLGYQLSGGDTIYVNVLRFPDLSFQGTIDLEGNLLVPLVGVLHLKGLTTAQARSQIQIALDRYVVNPQVDVILIAQRPVQVTILGEVVKPGLYPLPAPQLSVALLAAGGSTGLADLRVVKIRRTLADGSIAEREVDLFTPLRDAQSVPDLRLDDGDTIIIPTLTAESEGYDRNLIARSNLAQAQISIRVLNYATGRGGSLGTLQLVNGSSFVDALTAISPDLSSADIRHIALVRFDLQQGKAVTQKLDGKDAMLGDTSQNPMLEQNDVIVIGRNFVARITYALNTFTQPFRDILGFLLFFDSLSNSAQNLFQPDGSTSR